MDEYLSYSTSMSPSFGGQIMMVEDADTSGSKIIYRSMATRFTTRRYSMSEIFTKVEREDSSQGMMPLANIPERGIAVIGIFTPTHNTNAVKVFSPQTLTSFSQLGDNKNGSPTTNVLHFSRLEDGSTLETVNGACVFTPPRNPASSKSKSNSSRKSY